MERQFGFFKLRPISLDLGDFFVQLVAVALGVILGYAATAMNDREHERTLLRGTIGNIVQELDANRAGMRVVEIEHAKAASVLTTLVANGDARNATISFAQARRALKTTGAFRENVPLAIAWQIAQGDQGLSLLPYRDRYGLAWIYQMQTIYYQREERFAGSLLSITQSPNGNYFFQVYSAANELASVVATERQLDKLYTEAIKEASSRDANG